jgi:predicted SpoU family rRNA methylase
MKLIKKCKVQNDFEELVRAGLISVHLSVWFDIYSDYLEQLKTNKKRIAILYIADKNKINERTVYKIIDFMEN